MALSTRPMSTEWTTRASRYTQVGNGVPWTRLRMPSSRAMVMLMASVVKPALTIENAMMAGV